jgi:Tetracyclin repressor-like, C-terminal domain
VQLPTNDAGWRAGMRQRSVSLREALARHRWAIGLMESRLSPGPANLRQHNAMMGCLREAGFSFRTTVHSTSTLDAYIYGFALQEKTLPFETPEQSGEVAQAQLEQQAAAALAYPYLVEVVVELTKAGYDASAEFEIGLDLILDGIEKLRPEWVTAG